MEEYRKDQLIYSDFTTVLPSISHNRDEIYAGRWYSSRYRAIKKLDSPPAIPNWIARRTWPRKLRGWGEY